jgi:hypothetical protein
MHHQAGGCYGNAQNRYHFLRVTSPRDLEPMFAAEGNRKEHMSGARQISRQIATAISSKAKLGFVSVGAYDLIPVLPKISY